MSSANLLPLPVLLPLLGAALTLVARRHRRTQVAISLGVLCLLYTSPSPRDRTRSRMPSSA